MRVALLLLVLLVPATSAFAGGLVERPPAPLPDDVRQGLVAKRIGVADASGVPSSSLPVSAAHAERVARRNFGWTRGRPLTVHLVRLTDPGSGPAHALRVGSIQWLVVLRNAHIPILGGPSGRIGRGYRTVPLAVFVDTTKPRFLVALTI
jgi:hypothetical protein